jgi:hypothetical protein
MKEGIMEENVARKEENLQQSENVTKMAEIEKQVAELQTQMESLSVNVAENKISIIVFSGDLDKVLAAFVIATGAVAMGLDVGRLSSETSKRGSEAKISWGRCSEPCCRKGRAM